MESFTDYYLKHIENNYINHKGGYKLKKKSINNQLKKCKKSKKKCNLKTTIENIIKKNTN